jgi:16S rRNA (cytidine1402-2'-O)-methyltransferase
MLYIVPTPIGNLEDTTERAKQTLGVCDFIVCENPSQTAKLLQLLGLPKKQLIQLADFNEQKTVPQIIERLTKENACLVSDAGTPTISDPGFKLVRACREASIEVVSLPGANAVTTALAGSGLPTDKFIFVGFLPKTEPKVNKLLEEAKSIEATFIAYESPQRISKTISFIEKSFPDCKVVVAREISKMHEEYLIGSPAEVSEKLKAKPSIKGEIVLLISFK